ncbi:MAG: type II secretion system protein [Candidatus Omnitrophica bacterium]|nr:type II secretion system protein [Candidatus Omnitrophota bacterium]
MINSSFNFRNSAGFSLYEIMAVIVILSVLISLIIPNYSLALRRTENQEAEQVLRAIWIAQKDYQMENDVFASDGSQLDITIPSLKNFSSSLIPAQASCGSSSSVALAQMQKMVNGTLEYEIVLLDDGRIFCTPCGGICRRMGYADF